MLCLLFYVDFFVCYDVNSVNKNQSKYYKTVDSLLIPWILIGSNNGHRDSGPVGRNLTQCLLMLKSLLLYASVRHDKPCSKMTTTDGRE